jgi:CheY-like chemotaxis protein
MKILVIDDDFETDARYYLSALEIAGHDITTAGTPAEALEAIQSAKEEDPFEFIVLDIMLPPMGLDQEEIDRTDGGPKTGIVLLQKLLKLLPRAKVLILTILPKDKIDQYLSELDESYQTHKVLYKISTPPSTLPELIERISRGEKVR